MRFVKLVALCLLLPALTLPLASAKKDTQLILDVIDGRGGTFSLEEPTGKAFHTRSRVFTPEEQAWLDQHPPQDMAPDFS